VAPVEDEDVRALRAEIREAARGARRIGEGEVGGHGADDGRLGVGHGGSVARRSPPGSRVNATRTPFGAQAVHEAGDHPDREQGEREDAPFDPDDIQEHERKGAWRIRALVSA
jgi:hypothetical protein